MWKISANSQLYRQLTVGITEKHVQEVHKPFNRFDDKSAAADVNVVFAWQSGHRPIERATTYGLDGAFPAKLQPALLRAYEWASTRWHEFLHQPSKVMPYKEAAMIGQSAGSPSPPVQQSPDTNTGPAKRKTLPWSHGELHDTRPTKRTAVPGREDLSRVDNFRLAQNQIQLSRRADHATPIAKRPAHPAGIIVQVEAWQDGVGGKPISDDEGDSPIDWDEPDMIPSAAPTNGSLPSWSREPWPSWSRHNTRIEAKIDKARQFHGVFDMDELRPREQMAMRALKRSPRFVNSVLYCLRLQRKSQKSP